MDKHILWSLRLGFSAKQSELIEKDGLSRFLDKSFKSQIETSLPEFLDDAPKTLNELRYLRKSFRKSKDDTEQMVKMKKTLKRGIQNAQELKEWWLEKMLHSDYPLREKMTLFLQNHFVVTSKKVKNNYWVYQHNQLLRENAFGNFRELTKNVLRTNAMVKYLDNTKNRKGKINENLSRELLELFTLGIGNYTYIHTYSCLHFYLYHYF